MKTTIRITIVKNEAGLFTVEASDYTLGRQWDNNAVRLEIIKPVGFTESIDLSMDIYKYDRALTVYNLGVLEEGERYYYEGLKGIDSIEVRNEPVLISNHISQYENIRIKFIFRDKLTGIIKNSETKDFKFLRSEKPVNFISYDVSSISIKNGKVSLSNGIINYTYTYLGIQDPDVTKITFDNKNDLPLPAALILMAAGDESRSGDCISFEDFKKLNNSKITEIVASITDNPVISISSITYMEKGDHFTIQAIVNDASNEIKPCKLIKINYDSVDRYVVKSYHLDGNGQSNNPAGDTIPAFFGVPSAYQIPAGGTPIVTQYGDGTELNPYRLQFGLVDGKEGKQGIQGRNVRYRGTYVPGARYYFSDENQDVVSYTAEIAENGFKKKKSVLLYCVTTNQRADTVPYDENGIIEDLKDCWTLGPVTVSSVEQRFRGDWQPNTIYENNFENQDIVRVVKGTREVLLCCVHTNSSAAMPDIDNLSSDWKFFLKSSSVYEYAKAAGYADSKEEFDLKLIKILDYAQKSGGNIFAGNQQITGDLSVSGNIYHHGMNYQTNVEQLNVQNSVITLRENAVSAIPENQCAGIRAKHYNVKGDDGFLVFDNKGFAYVGDAGDLQRIATILPLNSDNMLLYYNPNTCRIESAGITRNEFLDIKKKCDMLLINEDSGETTLKINGGLYVKGKVQSEELISSKIGFNKN